MVAWTVIALILIAGLVFVGPMVVFRTGMDPGIPNIIVLLLGLLTWFAWILWALLFSRRSFLTRVVMSLIFLGIGVGFLLLFDLKLTGDVALSNWTLRRWGTPQKPVVATNSPVDPSLAATPYDFPGFLGPDRSGIVRGVKLDSDWNANPPREIWRRAVGPAWSGVTMVGDRCFTMEQYGAQECVTCYAVASGVPLWVHENSRRHDDPMMMGKLGPRSTPTFANGRLYCQGATGTLMCLDAATGNLIWKHEIEELVRSSAKNHKAILGGYDYTQEDSLAWGRATSPLVVDGLVVTAGGGPPGGPFVSMIAFDCETGEERWRGGDEMIAYGSPTYAIVAGVPQIMLICESKAIGVRPIDGSLLWKVDWAGSSTADANCCQVTIVSDFHVLLTKGYSAGCKLISLESDGANVTAREIEHNPRVLRTKFSKPVIRDGYVYGISDSFFECVRLDDLSSQWKERVNIGTGQILLVDDKILIETEQGTLMLVQADPESYKPLATHPSIKGICWNTIGMQGTRVIVRSDEEMACFELPGTVDRVTTASR
jgi:outer membrane protein assembly factor BamB